MMGLIGRMSLFHLPRLGFSPYARLAIGPYLLDLEVNHYFHMLMLLRKYEKDLEALLGRILHPGDKYVDVGAEVGYTAALAGALVGRNGKMLLFEPDPRAFPRLKRHMDSGRKDAAPETIILNSACSDAEREFEMSLAPTMGQSVLLQDGVLIPDRPTVRVSSIILDDVLRQYGFETIRLLKMDVEGHEIFALKGLQKTLTEKRIDFIIIEKNAYLLGENFFTPGHLHAIFARAGYVCIQENGCAPTRKSLGEKVLENLVYAKSLELLKEGFPCARETTPAEPFSPKEIERLWEEITTPDHPAIQANRIIAKVRKGYVIEGIREGEELLVRYPRNTSFRGHVAHWLLSIGEIGRARGHYLIMADEEPDNEEVAAIIKKIATVTNQESTPP